jgi:hypothetical protein
LPKEPEVTVHTERERVNDSLCRILRYLDQNGLVNPGSTQDRLLSMLDEQPGRHVDAIHEISIAGLRTEPSQAQSHEE